MTVPVVLLMTAALLAFLWLAFALLDVGIDMHQIDVHQSEDATPPERDWC